jgi:hypothetical protein
MDAASTTLLARLLEDAPPSGSPPAAAVGAHLQHRTSWYAPLTGPMVVADTALAATARAVPAEQREAGLDVLVVNTSGAGGLTALAARSSAGLRMVAVASGLRDLDDLAGNARRVVAAAAELDGVPVQVGLPDAPGWLRAVEVVEAAGLHARIGAVADSWRDRSAAERLAERLSVLVEADLPFAVAPGTTGENSTGRAVLALAMLVEALVDGADPAGAAELLLADPVRVRAGLHRWDDATATRVRRRLRSVAAAPGRTAADLVGLGVLDRPDG